MTRDQTRQAARRGAAFVVPCLCFLIFSWWSVAWLQQEEWWGVDDGSFLRWAVQADEKFVNEGFAAGMKDLFRPDLRNYGPTYLLYNYVTFRLFGMDDPAPHHLVRAVWQAFFLTFMWCAARNLGSGRIGAVLVLAMTHLCHASAITPDMQTYPANWWRIYASDTYAALPIASFWYCISIVHLRWSRKRVRWVSAALAWVSFLLACIAKMNYVYLTSIPVIGVVLVILSRVERGSSARVFFLRVLPWCIAASFLAIAYFGWGAVTGQSQNYADRPSLGSSQMLAAIGYYLSILWEAGFWFFPLAFLIGCEWFHELCRRRTVAPVPARRAVLAGCMLTAGIAGFVTQCTWPILVPRYMLSFMPHLALATGVLLGRTVLRGIGIPVVAGRVIAVAAFVCVAVGLVQLYLPHARGVLKLSFFCFCLCAPVVAAWKWKGIPGAKTAIRRVVACSISLHAFFLMMGYLDARSAFQAMYRGQNIFKEELRKLVRQRSQLHVWTTAGAGEFYWNSMWFLKDVEMRSQIAGAGDWTPESNPIPPAAIYTEEYFQPGTERWKPPGWGAFRFVPFFSVEGTPAGIKVMTAADKIEVKLPPSETDRTVGRVILRFDTASAAWNDVVEIMFASGGGETLGTTSWRGTSIPVQSTNEVPIRIEPPLVIRPGDSAVVTVRVMKDQETRSVFNWVTTHEPRLFFLAMQESDGGIVPEMTVEESVSWTAAVEAHSVTRESVVESIHVEPPSAVIRAIIKNMGWGYRPGSLRPIHHRVAGSFAVLEDN